MSFSSEATKSTTALFAFCSILLFAAFRPLGLSPPPTSSSPTSSVSSLNLFYDPDPDLGGSHIARHFGWSLSISYQYSNSSFFDVCSMYNLWASCRIFASFHPLLLLRSTSSIIHVHLLIIGVHRSHRLLHVFKVHANAPYGRYSLKVEVTLLQKLTFLWSTPTIGSVPTFIHARISCWSSSIVHFFAPPTVPPITSSTSPSLALASMFVSNCPNPPLILLVWMRGWSCSPQKGNLDEEVAVDSKKGSTGIHSRAHWKVRYVLMCNMVDDMVEDSDLNHSDSSS